MQKGLIARYIIFQILKSLKNEKSKLRPTIFEKNKKQKN